MGKKSNTSSLVLLIASTIACANALAEPISDFMDSREDVADGSYFSKLVNTEALIQKEVLALEKQVHSLGMINAAEDRVQIASKLLQLELECLKLYITAANNRTWSNFAKSSISFQVLQIYRNIRHRQEGLYEDMIRFVDRKLPGANGPQYRMDSDGGGHSLYLPNYRSEIPLNEDEKRAAYAKKYQEFILQGHTIAEIEELNAAFYKKMGNFTYVEYIQSSTDKIKATEGNAGHLLLAGGEPVKAAGQILFLKDNFGKIILIVVTNASGTYKGDLVSAYSVAERIAAETNTSMDKVIVTKGEPVSTQNLKIYMKSLGFDSETIKVSLAPFLKQKKSLSANFPKSLSCRNAQLSTGNIAAKN